MGNDYLQNEIRKKVDESTKRGFSDDFDRYDLSILKTLQTVRLIPHIFAKSNCHGAMKGFLKPMKTTQL